ncbi:MAG: hypothetical protein QXK24_00115 [Ignisphaera sp.]
MKIICEKCKFQGSPIDFTGFKTVTYKNNNYVELVFIVCPVCENTTIFKEFLINPQIAISDLLLPETNVLEDPDKALKEVQEKLKELKKKYLPDYER